MGSALGGLDNALLNQAFLTHPAVADFVASHGLSHVDTMAALVDTLRSECAAPDGARPLIAVTDRPGSFTMLEQQLRYSAAGLARYGLEAVACHLGQLEVRDRRVWLDGRPVDVIYRVFLIKDLLDPGTADLIDPLLQAAERGQVQLFAPMDAEMYGSKGALALLSDEANRHLFSAAELASLDRILPWTRMIRPGPVTIPGGERADMAEYALGEREHLVLKPTALHSGAGVIQGWLTAPDDWRRQLTEAMDGPFVLQRRIRPLAEPFPADGGPEPWVLWWGAFLGASGYGGMIVRGSTDPDAEIMSMPHGSTGTCCFHQPAPHHLPPKPAPPAAPPARPRHPHAPACPPAPRHHPSGSPRLPPEPSQPRSGPENQPATKSFWVAGLWSPPAKERRSPRRAVRRAGQRADAGPLPRSGVPSSR